MRFPKRATFFRMSSSPDVPVFLPDFALTSRGRFRPDVFTFNPAEGGAAFVVNLQAPQYMRLSVYNENCT